MRLRTIVLVAVSSIVACGGVVTSSGSTSSGTGGSSATSTGSGGNGSTTTSTSTTSTTSTSTGTISGVCVVGQDQTCNDLASVSAIWGVCQADGSCLCNPGFEVNPATGHCRVAPDGGPVNCGGVSCKDNEFCIERVHDQDAGPVPPTWMCELYFTCMEHTCDCALMNFVSASCIAPTCVSESPVWIRCDDLN